MTLSLIAYHNDPAIKAAIVAQIAKHRAADELVKGRYWENGKGCAVGCTIHGHDHALYELRFGIPQMLARLKNTTFEGLPNADAQLWPERFMGAIEPGQDLSKVGWWFLHWLLTNATVNPGITDPTVADVVARCAAVVEQVALTGAVDQAEAQSAASAARAAWNAAWNAAESAARSAAWSAAESAESAAWSAVERAVESAASATRVAGRVVYVAMADKLIALIEAAPMMEVQ